MFYLKGAEITEVLGENKTIARPRSVITGQFTSRINRLSASSEILMIQVVFKPGGIYRLTGIPGSELLNQHIDLESVFPVEGRETNDKLADAQSYVEMIGFIEEFLLTIVKKIRAKNEPFEEVFQLIAANNQNHSIDWLASQACLSQRQFERKSEKYVGVSPKHFSRIARFHQSYCMRLANPFHSWLTIAIATGYHDYQHLVKDYKEFASVPPTLLFNQESKALERTLGLLKE
ncbi:AraC family transcriptional regulator [Lacibacter sediminis]|uniref:AraC family transcriptional regulator n=1 Tax=Lacibacter sediminis TaxID=2760713 RepID=A0A7G5XEW2_9BACT|nr:AraC family transcriptional regulator [Lacibacter sediminis]